MMKNIVIGALAGAALAYLYVEKKNGKSIHDAYDAISDHFMKMKHKMKHMHKGRNHYGCGMN